MHAFWYLLKCITYAKILTHTGDHIQQFYCNFQTIPDIVLMSLLLILSIFGMFFKRFLADLEHVNAGWNALLL